jgi:aerobic carbon-monoxide dehydrogenase medium subunit
MLTNPFEGLHSLQRVPGLGLIATSIRTLAPVRLYRPFCCEQVADILHNEEYAPTLLAGGTDLCAQFNEGLAPRSLISLHRVAALRQIEAFDGEIRIGGAVTHACGHAHPLLGRQLGTFAQAWRAIANPRIRFRATIGGNLMALRPRYEMSVMLDALGAALSFKAGSHNVRLTPGEIWNGKAPARAFLEFIAIPAGDDFVAFRYDRSLRPTMTLALCIRGTNNGLKTRAVVATEMLAPTALDVPAVASLRELGSASKDVAAAAAATLSQDYADKNTSNWYLRQTVDFLLHRQLEDAARCLMN